MPSRMAPPFYDHAGRTLDGRYELIARVGAGAFATVYRARDRNVHGRVVAVKVLHPERASDQATVQRFLREVKLAARITGKHRDRLVQILDQGYCEAEAPGLLYFVMEFAFGPTLQGLLRQASGGTFLWPRAVALGHEVAQALVTLHGHGVIHRDIKPSNCILEEDRVRLLDLGIAKLLPDHEGSDVVRLTLPNMVVGTLRYMSPEQQSGHACDARADLYAVGVMLYEFLTGGGPVLRERSDHPAVNKPLGLVPPSVVAPGRDIPPAVDAVVLQALNWRPEERFQTAAALVAALAATMTNESTDEWTRRPRHLPLRQRWLFAAAHGLGVWTLLAGTTVAAVSLAASVSLAHGESFDGSPAALERDESPPATSAVARVDEPADAAIAAPPVVIVGAQEDASSSGPTDSTATPSDEAGAPPPAATTDGAATAGHATDEADNEARLGGASPTIDGSVARASRLERSALAARFAARRKQAIAACGPQIGLADRRGIKARVRVQVRPDGKVQARAQEPWQGTPVGDCLEGVARAIDFAATDQGGGFTWTLKF